MSDKSSEKAATAARCGLARVSCGEFAVERRQTGDRNPLVPESGTSGKVVRRLPSTLTAMPRSWGWGAVVNRRGFRW